MKARGLGWVGIRTESLVAMRDFCRRLFGAEPVLDRPDFVVFQLPDGSGVELFGADDPRHQHFATGPVVGFLVDDLAEVFGRLAGWGAEPLSQPTLDQPSGTAWAHFRAPDGNVYELTQRREPLGVSTPGVPPWPTEDHVCTFCDFRYAEHSEQQALAAIRTHPARFRRAIGSVPEAALRIRPAPEVWSVLEYLGHMDDVYRACTIRLHRIQHEQTPLLEPVFNDLRVERFGYNRRSPAELLAQLPFAAEGFCAEASAVPPNPAGSAPAAACPGSTAARGGWYGR